MCSIFRRLSMLIPLVFLVSIALDAQETPTFEQYRTSVTHNGKPAAAKPSGNARSFRTAIKEGAKEGPNFAGRYTIVTWGCGTGCIMFAIVDARTGKVFLAPFTVSRGEHLDQVEDLIEYRKDSKLLIITGDLNEENYGKRYYKWEKGKLTLVLTTISIEMPRPPEGR